MDWRKDKLSTGANRRRQREQHEPAGGDLSTQMRATMEEVNRREKAETCEKVCLIEKKVDAHEVKIQEHDRRKSSTEGSLPSGIGTKLSRRS